MVSKLQALRKEMGLDVVDKVRIRYATQDEVLKQTALEQREYLCGETMALSLEEAPTEADGFVSVDLGGKSIAFQVLKA